MLAHPALQHNNHKPQWLFQATLQPTTQTMNAAGFGQVVTEAVARYAG
jgi:hypothetical protein